MLAYHKHTTKLHERQFENGSHFIFWCPACEKVHLYNVGNANFSKVLWQFNGNYNYPTFTPSLRYIGENNSTICHVNITAGKIYYHGDNPHSYKDITVDMVHIPIFETESEKL